LWRTIDSALSRTYKSRVLLDYHFHTRFSDGVGEPKNYAARAVELGLDEIGVTDHGPLPERVSDWHMALENLESYVQLVEEAQKKFPAVTIRLGLEVDFIPGLEDFTSKLATQYPWDFFLGSVHFIDGWPLDSRADDWRGRDVDKVWEDYFRLWTQAAQTRLFDSLAHPDLP
jgi:histidinol-phosphatase (PHP family)